MFHLNLIIITYRLDIGDKIAYYRLSTSKLWQIALNISTQLFASQMLVWVLLLITIYKRYSFFHNQSFIFYNSLIS